MKGNVNFPVNYSTLFLEIYEQVFHVKCYMSWFPSRFVHIFSRTILIHFIWVEFNLISWACWFHAVYWRAHTYVLRLHGSRRLCENRIYNFELSTFLSRFELALPYQLMLLSTGRPREYTISIHETLLHAASFFDLGRTITSISSIKMINSIHA